MLREFGERLGAAVARRAVLPIALDALGSLQMFASHTTERLTMLSDGLVEPLLALQRHTRRPHQHLLATNYRVPYGSRS